MSTERCRRAIDRIDQANREDPVAIAVGGQAVPGELLYGRRMSDWLMRLRPEPTEIQAIAARGQHIRRWMIPRDRFPRTRVGYLQWRTSLYDFHARELAAIMEAVGYRTEAIERVQRIVRKRGLKRDADVQLVEDVACLVFLDHYFSDFCGRHDEDKVMSVIRKTWSKMSEEAHRAARSLDLDVPAQRLIGMALEKSIAGG